MNTMVMGAKAGGKSEKDNWQTPPYILDVVRAFYGGEFFDPCPVNADFDGLEVKWPDKVYINPPFSQYAAWASYGSLQRGEKIWMCHHNHDTQWFDKLITIDTSNLNIPPATNSYKEIVAGINNLADAFKGFGSMLQSTQEFLLDLSLKIDNLKIPAPAHISISEPIKAVKAPEKPKKSPEEIKQFRMEHARKLQEKRTQGLVDKVKQAQKIHPEFAKNPAVLSALSGVTLKAVQKYMEQGLI